jgi:hypothetical protein
MKVLPRPREPNDEIIGSNFKLTSKRKILPLRSM